VPRENIAPVRQTEREREKEKFQNNRFSGTEPSNVSKKKKKKKNDGNRWITFLTKGTLLEDSRSVIVL